MFSSAEIFLIVYLFLDFEMGGYNLFKNMKYSTQRKLLIFTFLFFPLLFLLVFTYIPAISMFYYSFLDWDGYSLDKKWVGFANYIEIFTNPEYFMVFKTSLYYFIGGIIQIILALYFAILLNGKIKGKNFFKAILFFPYVINGVAISLIFIFFFRPDGPLDSLLKALGLEGLIRLWIGDEKIVNWSLASVSIWRYMGYNFIIFLGALQSISPSWLEAAEIDGANAWQKIRYIILPSIKRVVEINLILNVAGAISVFEIPYIMTGGANGSTTFVIQTVDTAFKFNKFGLASAMAVVVLLIVMTVTMIERKFFERGES
jgi:multiple sugar transport system permease protein